MQSVFAPYREWGTLFELQIGYPILIPTYMLQSILTHLNDSNAPIQSQSIS